MPTFTIVDEDKDPLDPGEINAGSNISVNDGDVFIVDPTADATTTFESASGMSIDFEVRIEESNTNNFDLDFDQNTNPEVTISDDVDISNVKIDATNAESITLNAGNNVSIEEFDGSDGADTVIIGDDFTTTSDFNTGDGNDTVEIGNNADFDNEDIILGQGDNTLVVGSGLSARDITAADGNSTINVGDNADIRDVIVEDGNNTITLGDDVSARDITTGNGDNAISIGDGASLDDINTGDGADTINIGDNASIDDINTEDGTDAIVIGDDFDIDDLDAGDGDDFVRLGDDGVIDTLDGGGGTDTLSNGNAYTSDNFENVVCFTAGTLIETPAGSKAVETFDPGDLVRTMDNGAQVVRWVGKRFCSATVFDEHPNLRPIRIHAGAMGGGKPAQDLVVSPQHRVLVCSRISMRMFGQSEILAAAKQLVALPGIEIADDISEVTYVHLLCDRHEIVYSNGTPTETLYLGTEAPKSFDAEARQVISLLFPDLNRDSAMKPSRHLALGRQARTLAERHKKNARELLEALDCS